MLKNFEPILNASQGSLTPLGAVERFDFYARAKNAYCIIQTGERRFYGCFIFKKGVIAPNGETTPAIQP